MGFRVKTRSPFQKNQVKAVLFYQKLKPFSTVADLC
jgi:hypothetical protein